MLNLSALSRSPPPSRSPSSSSPLSSSMTTYPLSSDKKETCRCWSRRRRGWCNLQLVTPRVRACAAACVPCLVPPRV